MNSTTKNMRQQDLDKQFNLACTIIRDCQRPARWNGGSKDTRLPRLPLSDSNALYGLFKQSTEGDCLCPRPGRLDILGRGKWKLGDNTLATLLMQYLRNHDSYSRACILLTQLNDLSGSTSSVEATDSIKTNLNKSTDETVIDMKTPNEANKSISEKPDSPPSIKDELKTTQYKKPAAKHKKSQTDDLKTTHDTLLALEERLQHIKQAEQTLEKLQTELAAIQEHIAQHKHDEDERRRIEKLKTTGPRSWLRALVRHAFIHSALLVISLLAYRLTTSTQPTEAISIFNTTAINSSIASATPDVESAIGRPAWPLSMFVRWIDRWLAQLSETIRRFLNLQAARQ
ncbi:hypothetical protein BDF19DRAFT_424948 [Syncephalis fuscata]|nr:hypothetical protein BDF19DRAFT_424948 [Syncephalis fuscata]